MKQIELKKSKRILLLLGFLLIIGFSINPAYAIPTTEWISTTYDRVNIDRVEITAVANFTLNNNYTTLKLYYALWPTDVDSGTAIATKTIDYSNYNHITSGTAGEVKVSTVITAYDGNAKDVNVFGGDKVFLRLYIYNASVSSSNLIVKSSFDQDYWPLGGRYDSAKTSSASESLTDNKWFKIYIFIGLSVLGGMLVIYAVSEMVNGNLFGAPRGRDTIQYKDGRRVWAKRDSKGRFVDIQDPGRSLARDRATKSKLERQKR